MPVDLRTHDPDSNADIDPATNKAVIIKFLYSNPNHGYKPAELDDCVDMPKGSLTTVLVRLYDEGYIGKTTDGYYHALESRDDLRRFARGLVQVERLTDRYADDGFSVADVEQTDEVPVSETEGTPNGTAPPRFEEPDPNEWMEDTERGDRS